MNKSQWDKLQESLMEASGKKTLPEAEGAPNSHHEVLLKHGYKRISGDDSSLFSTYKHPHRVSKEITVNKSGFWVHNDAKGERISKGSDHESLDRHLEGQK